MIRHDLDEWFQQSLGLLLSFLCRIEYIHIGKGKSQIIAHRELFVDFLLQIRQVYMPGLIHRMNAVSDKVAKQSLQLDDTSIKRLFRSVDIGLYLLNDALTLLTLSLRHLLITLIESHRLLRYSESFLIGLIQSNKRLTIESLAHLIGSEETFQFLLKRLKTRRMFLLLCHFTI